MNVALIKYLSFAFFLVGTVHSFSQESAIKKDSLVEQPKGKWVFNLDLVSRYIWRGQSWGGNYFAVQPTITYSVTDKLDIGFWGTTNFKPHYFYPDGVTSYQGYQEIDFNVAYQATSFLSVQLWDYYWPSVDKVEGVDNGFFNYGSTSVKTLDAILVFNFSDYHLPLTATISTFVGGNDYRYNSEGENPKQNYTTYVELGYTLEELFQKVTLNPFAGAVLNNQAGYYTAGDYDQASLINVGIKATRAIDFGKGFTMPLSLTYIHNAALRNTETFGRNFLVAGLTFNYQ